MPESAAGEAAFLNGEEIINNARTLAYLDAGYGHPSLKVSGCSCPQIRELIECGSDPYVSPASDPAPWYDSSVPESGDFAGFYVTEFEGMGSTYTRPSVEKITGGAVLGRLRPQPRTLTWRGFLFGRSDCAVQYGLKWMTANLRGTNCVCGGEDLDLLTCCPALLETPATSGCTSMPEIQRPEACPPFTQPDAFRTLKNVGLVDGPKILSQRRVGCSSGCGSTSCDGDTLLMEIEFSLLAGNPYLYGCPVCLCVDATFPEFDITDCDWVKVADSNNPGIPCTTAAEEAADCPPPHDCSIDLDVCPPTTLPVIPPFEDRCFCDVIAPVEFCCAVPADSFGQFFEGAPVIEIFTGDNAMRSTTIRFFENLNGQPCCDVAENPCIECDSLQIRYIPAHSTMTIDSSTRSVTLICPGITTPMRAEHLTTTPFSWPILNCVDYCICVETEGSIVASNATVSISIVPREM